jgi:hypothetical protein
MLRKRMKQELTVLGLGTILVLGAGCGGVGNYVTGRAAPQPSDQHETMQGQGRDWTWGEVDAYEHSPIDSGAQGAGGGNF